MRETMIPN